MIVFSNSYLISDNVGALVDVPPFCRFKSYSNTIYSLLDSTISCKLALSVEIYVLGLDGSNILVDKGIAQCSSLIQPVIGELLNSSHTLQDIISSNFIS